MAEYPLCDVCAGVARSILANFKDMPLDRARAKALSEFSEIHDDSDCIEFYTCLPILRLTHGEVKAKTTSRTSQAHR